jgi:hypothetical protein
MFFESEKFNEKSKTQFSPKQNQPTKLQKYMRGFNMRELKDLNNLKHLLKIIYWKIITMR